MLNEKKFAARKVSYDGPYISPRSSACLFHANCVQPLCFLSILCLLSRGQTIWLFGNGDGKQHVFHYQEGLTNHHHPLLLEMGLIYRYTQSIPMFGKPQSGAISSSRLHSWNLKLESPRRDDPWCLDLCPTQVTFSQHST